MSARSMIRSQLYENTIDIDKKIDKIHSEEESK